MEDKKDPIKVKLSTAILLFIIFLLIVVITGVCIYYNNKKEKIDDTLLTTNMVVGQDKEEIVTNTSNINMNEKENSNTSMLEQLDIYDELVQKLYKYILKYNDYDEKLVYQKQKVTNETISNKLKLNTIFYNLSENEASKVETSEYENKIETFNKNIIELKAKEIFGNNVTIEHESCSYQFASDITYKDGIYKRSSYQGGGGTLWEQSFNVLMSAEQNDDEIYIYDKYVHLVEIEELENGYYVSKGYDIYATSDRKIKLKERVNLKEEGVYTINLDGDVSREDYNRALLENLEKIANIQIKTFKHTFKKDTTGNYYWESTQIQE